MTPEQWRAVRAHFEALCDLSAQQQASRLAIADWPDHIKARVASMLAAEQNGRVAEQLVGQAPQVTRHIAGAAREGQTVCPCTVREMLGPGPGRSGTG